MKTLPPVKLVTSWFRNGMFCVCSVTPPRRQDPDDPSVLEEDRALVAVDGELRVHGDVLVGVLVDDELFEVVRARDHHLAHAALDEVENTHGLHDRWRRSPPPPRGRSPEFVGGARAVP